MATLKTQDDRFMNENDDNTLTGHDFGPDIDFRNKENQDVNSKKEKPIKTDKEDPNQPKVKKKKTKVQKMYPSMDKD